MTRCVYSLGAAGLLALLAGCNTEPPPLTPVHGQVFYHGTPVREGTVVFTPDAARGGSGPLARAEIQSDGSYVLHTEGKPGAAAGWHRVTILAVQASDGSPAQRRALVPRRYSDPELSGISCLVKLGQDNTFDLRLE